MDEAAMAAAAERKMGNAAAATEAAAVAVILSYRNFVALSPSLSLSLSLSLSALPNHYLGFTCASGQLRRRREWWRAWRRHAAPDLEASEHKNGREK